MHAPSEPPLIRFDHLQTLTGPLGLFEHARYDDPRRDHGYTTDDNARALVVLAGATDLGVNERALFDRYLGFVLSGRVPGGWHNRMADGDGWLDHRGADDAHGRALWGLGQALHIVDQVVRQRILDTLVPGLDLDTPSPRANAFAALGAVAAIVHTGGGAPAGVETALARYLDRIPRLRAGSWAWPEDRLAYANARLPEALLAAGHLLADGSLVTSGLEMLDWLVVAERGPAGFSFTPVGGRGPGETAPDFDQQPIEAWAMAEACARAAWITKDSSWTPHVFDAAEWFLGRNDVGAVLYDAATGAGYDGLHRDGVNHNRGAESTLAGLGALQALERHRAGLPPL